MSDVKAWVGERQAIHSYTTEDWQHYRDEDGGNFWAGGGRSDFHLTVDDAAFCVDAHKNLPRALNALERVLGLHVCLRNSASALYPTPLCTCGQNYPCPTVQAIEEAINDGRR